MICCCLPPRHCRAIYSHLEESANLLLSKHDRPLTTERQFADHVKHQLRNPQASLRPLLQMLQQAEQEDERMMILNNLVRSNDKALRLIEQLLQSGRVNHQDLAIGPSIFTTSPHRSWPNWVKRSGARRRMSCFQAAKRPG
ncbi:histidine kinase dimerization/phospho-acceptor domain-containing protein [Brucella pseudogrignonensis]